MARILVVDDRAINRAMLVSLLGPAGHATAEAGDGLEALAQVAAWRPDLVICDLLMPTMDGYEFARSLRADPALPQPEIVFFTATFVAEEARTLAAACGVRWLLTKPCEPEEILRTVNEALARADPPPPPADTGFDREHLRFLTDRLSDKVGELEQANRRLSALTELNLLLASERDPLRLLDTVAQGARALLGARWSVLRARTRNGEEGLHVAVAGRPPDEAARVTDAAAAELPWLEQAAAERRPQRRGDPSGDPHALGLPAAFGPVHEVLVAPVVSLERCWGWLLLADRGDGRPFDAEDERLLAIHAAQAGRIYENGSLYRQIKHTADRLQVEIEERERAARLLHEANESLEQRVRARTAELHEVIAGLESFNRNVSHDLRGPLGGIAGAARLAREHARAGRLEQAARFLEAIAAQAEVSTQLVESLLALARASNAQLQRGPVDMRALAGEALGLLQEAQPGRPLPVEVGPLPVIDADRLLVRQVLVNLIGNALKFSSQAAQPRVEVGVAWPEPGGEPVFHVRDNGVGFEPEAALQLFRPFQRLHGARFAGSGVGLSIVRRIVDHHGGRVWAEGAPGAGACVYFSLGPAAPPRA